MKYRINAKLSAIALLWLSKTYPLSIMRVLSIRLQKFNTLTYSESTKQKLRWPHCCLLGK